jgi:hypothetical protein
VSEQDDTVPTKPPFGGITDSWHKCRRCGEHVTGCSLCAGMPRAVVVVDRVPSHD